VLEHIVVVSGSAPLEDPVINALPREATILAVDGGLDHALAAGLTPSRLIGDLDSVSSAGLAWANANAMISRHSTDKDRTDTELALALAAEMHPARITLIGGGNRLDHSITAIGALGHRSLMSILRLDGWWNGEHFDVLHGPGELKLVLPPGLTAITRCAPRPLRRCLYQRHEVGAQQRRTCPSGRLGCEQ